MARAWVARSKDDPKKWTTFWYDPDGKIVSLKVADVEQWVLWMEQDRKLYARRSSAIPRDAVAHGRVRPAAG